MGQTYRQKALRSKKKWSSKAASIKDRIKRAVTQGLVVTMRPRSRTRVRPILTSHRLRNCFGQPNPRPKERLAFSTKAPRENHSPATGKGQAAHHARAAKGRRKTTNAPHQMTQTEIIEKFLAPIGVPQNPVRITRIKAASPGIMSANWKPRQANIVLIQEKRKRSRPARKVCG